MSLNQQQVKLLKSHGIEVQEEIASGATKRIYRALMKKGRRKIPVVVKQVLPELLFNDRVRKIFRQEPAALLRIDHPNVERAYRVIETDSDLFMVCEYIKGRSLQEYLDGKGPLDLEEALLISVQIASGLSAIHRAGLVHRDLSLSNVMLTWQAGTVRAKIIDLGLAKRYGHPGISMFFYIEGTPPFAAPEQLASPGFVDERADIFSLGTLMYYMLTLNFPFGDRDDYYGRALKRQITPLDKYRQDLDSELVRLIYDCLNPDPQSRPLAEEVVSDLSELISKSTSVDEVFKKSFTLFPSELSRETPPLKRLNRRKEKISITPGFSSVRKLSWKTLLLIPAGLLLLFVLLTSKGEGPAPPPSVRAGNYILTKVEVFTGTERIVLDRNLREIKREFKVSPRKIRVYLRPSLP